MPEKDIFAARERWLEETYFRKQDERKLDQMHARTETEADRARMAEITGLQDEDAITALQEMGFTSETVDLLHLLPLVEVAWAEGAPANRERELIFKLARARGIREGGEADQILDKLLTDQPSGRFFETTLHATRVLLEALPEEKRVRSRENIIAYCNEIAGIMYGGILGHAQIPDEERRLINHIAEELGWHEKAPR